ncbi:hypothetical protein G8O30_07300 [Mangrovibacillus cuniculi]|uniref:Uncharacterized protein n=2 Tax=Mangrovibacillus cuniculi TaxID=2593652 RepID=A0A7S8HH25_9BACI|nr:hypothetical protein G8O30_07300 [Mangrovibacillus cuniculi]
MFNQYLLWTLLIAPWFLLIPLPKEAVKRYMPASIFGALVLSIVFQMADALNWWKVKENIFIFSNTTPFVYGLFLVGTLIIMYFTYHKAILFFITNLLVDSFLAFGVSTWFEYLGIYELQEISSIHVLLITTIVAVLIYLFQKWLDPILK